MYWILCSGVRAVGPRFACHSESFVRVPVFVVAKAPMKDIERRTGRLERTGARCCGAMASAAPQDAMADGIRIASQRAGAQRRPEEVASGAGGVAGGVGGVPGTCSIILSVSCWPGERSPLPMSGSSMRCLSGGGGECGCRGGAMLVRSAQPAGVQRGKAWDLLTPDVEKLVDKSGVKGSSH